MSRIKIKKYSRRHTWMYKMIHSKRQDLKYAKLPRVYIHPRYMHEDGLIDTNPEGGELLPAFRQIISR